MEAAIAFVMGAALGFLGGALYAEWTRKTAKRIEEKYHSAPASEMFKEE